MVDPTPGGSLPPGPSSHGIAALPMYDWPELHADMDRLWRGIAVALRERTLPAPAALSRELAYDEAWSRADLVLGETCGLPLATTLAGRVGVVGVLDHALAACPSGHYRSAILVRENGAIRDVADARGARLAINNLDSQSGFHALIARLPEGHGRFFGSVAVTGAHRSSIRWLLDGQADIAAIDCHALRLAERFGPDPDGLRTIGYTAACPGTPLICSPGLPVARVAEAVEAALDALPAGVRRSLQVHGLWRARAEDYAPMADPRIAARARDELQSSHTL